MCVHRCVSLWFYKHFVFVLYQKWYLFQTFWYILHQLDVGSLVNVESMYPRWSLWIRSLWLNTLKLYFLIIYRALQYMFSHIFIHEVQWDLNRLAEHTMVSIATYPRIWTQHTCRTLKRRFWHTFGTSLMFL